MEDADTGKVIVVCRFRPLNDKEQQQSKSMCVEFSDDEKSVKVNSQYENGEDLGFTFDHIFSPLGSQQSVYEIAAKPVIDAIFQGFNGTVLAYGQTSSGKTYTMSGYDASDVGIIPRLITDLFAYINNADQSIEFTVKVSFCEIYLERIKDLIDPSKNNLKIQEDKARGVHMPELTETYVITQDEVMDIMKIGTNNREVSYTQMNATSSRSHSIFIVNVSQSNTKDYSAKSAKLYLVDLAGSEKVGKTGAAGKRLEEAKNINKSLTTLGQVITALTDCKASHIPYRDSKLTRVLQDSLGGNAKTTLILTCSPSPWNEAETLSTLRFGIRAKAIKNKPKINREYTASELKLMLYAAKEEIKKKDKIIEALQGHEVNESHDERSLSVMSLCGNELIETVHEIERLKANLANEVRKSLKLQIENNEKQLSFEREKRENEKMLLQLNCNKNNTKILEDEINIREENIRLHAVKLAKTQLDLEESLKQNSKNEVTMQELREENEKYTEESKSLQQQLASLKIVESQNLMLQSNLDFEMISNKKLQEELFNIREKLELTIAKAPNIEQIRENIIESVRHKEKVRWENEKNRMIKEFEEHFKRFLRLENEAKQCKESFSYMQIVMQESEKRLRNKINQLEDSNREMKSVYENVCIKYAEIKAEYDLEKKKRIALGKKAEGLEDEIKSRFEKACEIEGKLNRMQTANNRSSMSENNIVLGHFKKTIKGGQNLAISYSPDKQHFRQYSTPSFPKGDKENREV